MTAAVATLVGSIVVFHPPFTPWVKWITAVYGALALALFLVAFLTHFRWQESRNQTVRNLHAAVADIINVRALDAFLLMIVSAVLLAGSLLWPAPDERQIAQQMLNDRGMFLTRQYFKTALEVGNTHGVDLFLKAGFSPALAVNLFGESAETMPDRRVIDTFFALDDNARHTILKHLAGSVDRKQEREEAITSMETSWSTSSSYRPGTDYDNSSSRPQYCRPRSTRLCRGSPRRSRR